MAGADCGSAALRTPAGLAGTPAAPRLCYPTIPCLQQTPKHLDLN